MSKLPGIYPLHQMLLANPPVAEAPVSRVPNVDHRAVTGTHSLAVGDITVAEDAYIGLYTSVRADASAPYYIGPRTNIQDFAVIHCLPGEHVVVEGRRYGVFVEGDVSFLPHAAAQGPLTVGGNSFIGQHASISDARIGRNCVIMHGAVVTGGVTIASGRFVAPGQAVWTQSDADALPAVPEQYRGLNARIVDFYCRLGKSYKRNTLLAF